MKGEDHNRKLLYTVEIVENLLRTNGVVIQPLQKSAEDIHGQGTLEGRLQVNYKILHCM